MLAYELDSLLVSLPIEYGNKAHEVEQSRHEYEIAEAEFERAEASTILSKLVSTTETNKTLAEKKAKYETIELMFKEKLMVLQKRSTYRALECELDTLDKKIMLLNKQADRIKNDIIQGLAHEKAGSSLAK